MRVSQKESVPFKLYSKEGNIHFSLNDQNSSKVTAAHYMLCLYSKIQRRMMLLSVLTGP